jgi:asparagine synthase (glutamine-hydrolysing)
MSGIFGICEPGIQLQTYEMTPMALAMGVKEQGREQLIGGTSSLLGCAEGASFPSLSVAHGLYVATDADLCNSAALLAEHERSSEGSTSSSAELIAHLYARYGLSFVEKLEGAFSLALWDPQRQRLVLAIDRFGFKALYWSCEGSRMLFASRLGAIRRTKGATQVDAVATMQFLVHAVVSAPLTMYKGIERLEPGFLLVHERGQTRKSRYWDLNYEESPKSNVREWREQLRECMRQAVHSNMDLCPLERTGAYLSGGTDSSSVVAFASEVRSPFDTFSIYFENPRYDEIGFAHTAAEHFHSHHHEKCLGPADAVEAIPTIIDFYEEPFANSSAIGAYHCARLARERGVDVLLAGDGGDELFAGNERYSEDKKFALYHSIPKVLRNGVIRPVADLMPKTGPLSLPARYIRRADLPNPRRMFSYNFFLAEAGLEVFEPDFIGEARPETALDIAQAHFDTAPQASSELNRLLYLDVKMTLADNDLRKVVGTAELAGVKVRFPLLDRRLAELSGRIPSNLKLRGFEKRYVFKEAMKGILPDRILYKKKHGFGVPVGYWMVNDPGMKDLAAILDEPQSRQRGYLRTNFLSRLKELNRTHPAYFGEVLWMVLVLELWHRRHQDCVVQQSRTCGVGATNAR